MNRRNLAVLLDERLPQLKTLLANEPRVLAVFLFGSQVDGYATPRSDIDLAMLFDGQVSLSDRLTLEVAITQVLGTDRFDLVNLNEASVIFQHRAISGRLLYERDPLRVSDFLESTLRRYQDYAPRHKIALREYFDALGEEYGYRSIMPVLRTP